MTSHQFGDRGFVRSSERLCRHAGFERRQILVGLAILVALSIWRAEGKKEAR